MNYTVQRFTLPDNFEKRLKQYMDDPKDREMVSQHTIDYNDNLPELIQVNDRLNQLYFYSGYRNIEEFCNDILSPNIMIKILDFIMKREIKEHHYTDAINV